MQLHQYRKIIDAASSSVASDVTGMGLDPHIRLKPHLNLAQNRLEDLYRGGGTMRV